MAKPNYAFAKRQRELAKKQKKEGKRQQKADAVNGHDADATVAETGDDPARDGVDRAPAPPGA